MIMYTKITLNQIALLLSQKRHYEFLSLPSLLPQIGVNCLANLFLLPTYFIILPRHWV